MKNVDMKSIIFVRAIAYSVVLFSIGFSSCRGKYEKEIVPSFEFAPYVNAYTGGIISHTSTIRVKLSQDHPDAVLQTEIKKNPFKFSPSLKGKTYWVSSNTIEFVPEEGELKSGKQYKASFKLGSILKVNKELELFQFSFKVLERHFTIDVNALDITETNLEQVTLRGEVRFSDNVDKKSVEKMLSVKTGDKQSLQIVVSEPAGKNLLKYGFVIEGIKRKDKDILLTLEAKGNVINVNNTIKEEIIIPANNEFKYLFAKKISQPENGIQVVFSEPISTSQHLKGLIEIEELPSSSYVHQVSDNKVNIYFEPTHSHTTLTLCIDGNTESVSGKSLGESYRKTFEETVSDPGLSLISSGTIMPDSRNLIIPFRAVRLRAVDLSVIRIFENNVLMFLQDNSLSASNELRRSGRMVYKKTLHLDGALKDAPTRQDYSVDLTGLIEQEPGAIYRVVLSYKQEYIVNSGAENGTNNEDEKSDLSNDELTKVVSGEMTEDEEAVWDIPSTYYYMYSDSSVSCNILASNLGLIVKRNSADKIWVAVNNILDTTPVSGADVTAYNFQLQPIGSSKTDAKGFALINAKGIPFVIMVSSDKQKTYVKVTDGNENSMTRFDTGGKEIQKGLKGSIYGERGVWRPGDTLFVAFILEDRQQRIPEKHPVTFELYNPRGQFYNKSISTNGINGFYTFQIPTKADDPTGLWNAYVKIGGTTFHKSFRIETIKPNRLKINLELPKEIINASSEDKIRATLSSAWLTGATASDLKTKVEMVLTKVNTQFKNYDRYVFNNPVTGFESSKMNVFEGTLDKQGNVIFDMKMPKANNAPGMLRANITSRVFEQGGDASIHTISVPFSPYSSYVGINLNQPTGKYIETDQDHVFDVVTLDAYGKPINRSGLEYKIYRVGWSWWWEEESEQSFESYINNTYEMPVAEGELNTSNGGKAQFKFRVDYPSWGRYLVYVKDRKSGHATGGTVLIDWPDWRGRSNKSDPNGLTMLAFSLDKESYEVGETVTAIIPTAADGRALAAIENGSSVISREWVQVSSKGDTKYQFKITEDMAPNVYLHITLLQPHAQTVNDLPIRLYGVVPVFVTNKGSVLEPQIKMPDVLHPEKEFSVTVSEKHGKPMTYTLAIVDDGLLDLTNFKTPDPWTEFYAREALGIRTWDMYNDVIGAYTGKFSSLFSTGGDESAKSANSRINRFQPIVKYIGPFTINKGDKKTHKITLPLYVGSVRTMVVAGQRGAYGSVEKTTPVRTPLMLLSSLPRIISIGEDILLPVNVFAMEDSVKNVTVTVETSDNLRQMGGNKKSLTFTKPGDQMVYFNIKTGVKTGKETVKITAKGGGETAKETIEIEVRNPNPVITRYESKLLETGETGKLTYTVNNSRNDSWVKLEVSRIPSVDISRRFDFLYNYRHYCSEQLTSRALPLLFVTHFKDIEKDESEYIKTNVQEAIKNLYSRQLANGGIVYWAGDVSANEWITSYAGSFLVIAQEKGYEVNKNVLDKWKSFQRSAAQNWKPAQSLSWYDWQSELQQAYRLYTLALSGAPETGAMNRMKGMKSLSVQAKWRLAAAYALTGKMTVANELVSDARTTIEPYSSNNYIYGSYDRDEAMILETLVLMKRDKESFTQAQKVSKNLTQENYFTTQSTAFSLVAMGRLAEKLSGTMAFDWTLNGNKRPNVKSAKAIYQISIPTTPDNGNILAKNNGNGILYVNLISRTQLVKDTLPAVSNNLRLDVNYLSLSDQPVDVNNLKQGTDFKAIITVTNINGITDYRDIALTHIIPSGWEIYNDRMTNSQEQHETTSVYTYRDIRDDRVLTYFDLDRNRAKEFTVRLQASYAGTFALPSILCEAMYDVNVQAKTKAGQVTVSRQNR
jgi:uncharacterized protein YfaS (alpha-2-macroglobulin family)